MLGLVYLTSVAGLIATSAVLHQLSLSKSSQSLLTSPVELSPAHFQTSNINQEAPTQALRLPCCVLANKSQNPQINGIDQQHGQNAPSASSQTSVLCLWGSLLASIGHIHPETHSEDSQAWSTASFFCPGCLATLPPLQCRFRNTTSLFTTLHSPFNNHHHYTPLQASNLPLGSESSLNSHLWPLPTLQMRRCHPESMLAADKPQALLMPG